ncbi:MAG: peroxidase, partial [Gammaproteobacteria bacterium]|nr:peroxidase [Gammaproteobacteria bacterium]
MNHQSGILDPIADHAVFMEFDAVDLLSAADLLDGLASRFAGTGHVLGIGRPLADGLGAAVPGLDPFPDYSQGGLSIPSTQHALLLILRGDDPAALDESASALGTTLSSCFSLAEKTGGFKYEGGRDLTGYEDGTEN